MWKRVTVLLIFVLLIVSSAVAQKDLIDVNIRNGLLSELVLTIEKQTGYTFMYDNTLDKEWRFTVSEKRASLEKVLKKAFSGKQIEFLFVGNQIILKKKTASSTVDLAPKRIVGVVTDESGSPLSGVVVFEKGTENASVTDAGGEFRLDVSMASTLLFRHITYMPVAMSVSQVLSRRVVMVKDEKMMEEVMVLGYGRSLKRDLTGAVTGISSEVIKNQALVKDFIQALQGQVAGADITTENAPGDGSTIHIRGYSSLNAGNAPLVVLDDAPFSGNLSDLNPNEIERIDILKDASSTAIYGSRGANGVVIITTKRGNTNGKLMVEYNGYYGVGKSTGNFDMMDGDTYLKYRTLSGAPFDAIQNRVIEKGRYTNWQKLMFDGTSQKTDHTLTVNMSSVKSRSTVQLGYNREQGIIANMTYERMSGRFTGDLDLSARVKLGYSASISHSRRENGDASVWKNGTLLDPLTEVYDENGAMRFYNSGWNMNILHSNPLFDTKRENVNNQAKRDRMLGNINISTLLSDYLTFKTSLTYDYTGIEEGGYYSSYSQNRSGAASGAFFRKPTESSVTFTNNLSYARILGKHDLKITVVHDMQQSEYYFVGASGFDLPYSGLWYNVNESQLNLTNQANRWDWAILSFMGRINYTYDNRYLFTVTGRGDGSSKLSRGHKWGFFPSAAFAWRLSEEPLLKQYEQLSNLKIRLGWGISGNTAINAYVTSGKLGRFPYNFGVTSDNAAIGYVPTEVPNPNLGWERTSEVNIGIDFGFFNNKINGTVDIYRKNTYDLLMKRNLPTTSGYHEVWQNVGQTRNTGIELSLQTTLLSAKESNWTTNLTFNYNKNEIVSLFNGAKDSPGNKWFIGQPIDVEWITKYVGVWQTNEAATAAMYSRIPGQTKLLDANNDKIIDQNDNFVYNRIPKFVGGFSSTFKYKNYDFSVYLYTRLDYGSMVGIITMPDFGTANWNQIKYNFWTPENPTNDGPQPSETRDAYAQGSSYAFRDLSFVRLKNINLGYTLTPEVASRLRCKMFRIFAVVDNPFVWTKSDYIGIDPENCSSPTDARPLRSVALGINAKF